MSRKQKKNTPAENKEKRAISFARLKKDKRFWIGIVIFVLILALVLLAILSPTGPLDYLKRLLHRSRGETYGVIRFDDHNFNRYAAVDDGIAVATTGGLFLFDLYGTETAAAQMTMNTPFVQSGGELTLACDIGGATLCAVSAEGETVLSRQLDGTLLDADLSDGGAFCYAITDDNTKTRLCVFDPEQNEIYNWNSQTVFFNQCCVSTSASYLVGVSIGQNNGSFVSTGTIFRTDSDEPVAQVDLGSELYLDMDFVTSGTVCAVGENGLRLFTCDGTPTAEYEYASGDLTDFDLAGDGFIALAMNKNKAGSKFTLTTLDNNAREIAALDLDERIIDLSAAGNYLAVLTSKRMVVYNSRLKVCLETTDIALANHVIARSDGSALLIRSGTATLIA